MFWESTSFELQALIQVGLAMLLGAAIGFEREMEEKPAGLRTHMLVAGAAAFFVLLGLMIVERFLTAYGIETVRSDPVRIIQAVTIGVSFLGAGTILRQEDRVEGLTTAASILFAAGLGISVALQKVLLPIGLTLFVLITLRGLGVLEDWLERRRK